MTQSHPASVELLPPHPLEDFPSDVVALGDQRRGFRGVIFGLRFDQALENGGLSVFELERRLLEMGFVEGARIEILHEGFIRRDPIAVRLDDMRVALRRREGRCILVRPEARA